MRALLDTLVVLRYLTGDPPHLFRPSVRLIEGGDDLLVSDVVVAETAHVLTSYYGASRGQVVDHLLLLLQRDNVDMLHLPKELAIGALAQCRPSGRVSIPDALIWTAARAEDLPVYTLDRRFPAEGITVLSPQ